MVVGLDHTAWYKLQKQASTYDTNVSQPALAGGRVDPATSCITLVWTPTWWPWLAKGESCKMGVGMYSPEEERAGWGRETGPLDSGAREGEARLRGVCSLGGETGPRVLSTKGHPGSLSRQLTQGRVLEWESAASWGWLGRKGAAGGRDWGRHPAGASGALGQISPRMWRRQNRMADLVLWERRAVIRGNTRYSILALRWGW